MADREQDLWDYKRQALRHGIGWEAFAVGLRYVVPWMHTLARQAWVEMYKKDLAAQQQKQKQQ
jgi:hypothetical protein